MKTSVISERLIPHFGHRGGESFIWNSIWWWTENKLSTSVVRFTDVHRTVLCVWQKTNTSTCFIHRRISHIHTHTKWIGRKQHSNLSRCPVTLLLTGPQNRSTIKVKSMSITLLINSTLYPGSVFWGELQSLVINLIYENWLVIEYQYTALWTDESTESIWCFEISATWSKLVEKHGQSDFFVLIPSHSQCVWPLSLWYCTWNLTLHW